MYSLRVIQTGEVKDHAQGHCSVFFPDVIHSLLYTAPD